MIARSPLRRWYGDRRRAYPWRVVRDPYRVLVSEVMLQQTQAARVVPAYRSFVRAFPTVRALAGASRADVLRTWAGLGYNRRAVALHDAARVVVRDHGGRLPADPATLQGLPGVGPYTATAVASIAFGRSVAAIDTNVARVVRRAVLGRDKAKRAEIETAARDWLDRSDPGGWNQAVMDLGREVCRAVPLCDRCPLAPGCAFLRVGAPVTRSARREPRFEGSSRQLRGAIVGLLRDRGTATVGTVAAVTGRASSEIARALATLSRDGLVVAGAAALAGRPRGRIRLPEWSPTRRTMAEP
jgi:A/G-specific adenine glycosylase